MKDYNVLYTVEILELYYYEDDIHPNHWPDFLKQPGNKPIVDFYIFFRDDTKNLLARLKKYFSSADVPNAFKIVFALYVADNENEYEHLTEFRDTNTTSGEILELKKGLPVEYQKDLEESKNHDNYMLERSSI
ncbi:hypothetical protein Ddc_18607 [Ditylenchus destructor]|nr:hypothetical protein Ddc_18607 [Ditylenchus destructor]